VADIERVVRIWSACPEWWNWRISGHFRAASLGSVWALVLFAPALGPVFAPVAAGRFALSTFQLGLNRQLGRRHPLTGRTRFDWALLGIAFLGSCLASALKDVSQGALMVLVLMPVAVPYSAIQVRMCMRSYRAHGAVTAPRSPRIVEFPATDVAQAA
jgi:hypothetical protein